MKLSKHIGLIRVLIVRAIRYFIFHHSCSHTQVHTPHKFNTLHYFRIINVAEQHDSLMY